MTGLERPQLAPRRTTSSAAATRRCARSCDEKHDARAGHRRRQGVGPARPRRRGLPDRPEVELHAAPVPGRRSTSSATPTKASPAPARTATSCATTRTSLIEGMAIAGYAMGCTRRLQLHPRRDLARSTSASRKRSRKRAPPGYLGNEHPGLAASTSSCTRIHGYGAYICGEETALLESLEGKKGQPRFKPPFPASFGLYGKPTTINNTETFAAVPWIIRNGGEAFLELGKPNNGGTKIFSVSGHVEQPGQLRSAARHAVREAARDGRRRARRPQAEGGDPGRLVGAGAAGATS